MYRLSGTIVIENLDYMRAVVKVFADELRSFLKSKGVDTKIYDLDDYADDYYEGQKSWKCIKAYLELLEVDLAIIKSNMPGVKEIAFTAHDTETPHADSWKPAENIKGPDDLPFRNVEEKKAFLEVLNKEGAHK